MNNISDYSDHQWDKQIDRWLVSKLGEYLGNDSTIYYWGYEYWEQGSDPRSDHLPLVGISFVGPNKRLLFLPGPFPHDTTGTGDVELHEP
ncbi:unnamed protein product [Oppiella nova]|uniref:Uncharacterized protein n=1 Tax=Oppiella nova TaxID=334625 RepID=A0A7R9MN53_9ACAR|nr:unnamed protein product [Oppiella nova]CAG2179310.1 unnamed protein product [Oppiella nova]